MSYGGRLLAQIAAEALDDVLPGPVEVRGMRLPVLRETRMPAVVCRLPTTAWSASLAPQLGRATTTAVTRWATLRRSMATESEVSTDPRVE